MNFPVTGALLVVLSVYFFFFAPRWLYLATVFLIPFSAMAVVNVGWGGGQKGIAAWMYMGALWMVRTAISKRPFWRHIGWRLTRRTRVALWGLLACGFISLLVPLILNGTVWIQSHIITSGEMTPLRLSVDRITQTGYFAYGVVFVIFVGVENCDPRRLLESVRAYVASAIFVSFWAFVQLWCILTGHAYPAFLFNNSMGTSAQLYIEEFSNLGLHRISSVAVEPSQLAFSMLLAFLVLLVAVGLRRPVLSRKWDMAALLGVTAALAISTSTTAYAGLVLASCLSLVALARAGTIRWLYVVFAAGLVAVGVTIALAVPLISDLVDFVILNKAQGYSATERLHSVVLGAHYFLAYPIFGLSWNAANSEDLLFQILSSLGIAGFIAFAVFMTRELRKLWRASALGSRWSIIFFAAVILMLVLSEATGLPYAMGYFWLTLGLGISAPFIAAKPATAVPAVLSTLPRLADRSSAFPGPADAGAAPY
ncbi:MAG: hypothetical protein EPN47_02390 [Acidobacteria bacterium]|nr:MAG: hypothetical protein EPN47_02390 [Acidobacteriota bacterium]